MASGGQVCLVVCRQESVSLCQGRPQQWGGFLVSVLLTRRLPELQAQTRISIKYLILLVGAQGFEPWTR